ncbi:MAG TPA: DNA polymerase I [Pseudobacteroides sp.]|uniref:DNA polymerase I n=1 Tax=Pseudobacteroides sp. TaxID=1968840 RepID=UPI002F93B74B
MTNKKLMLIDGNSILNRAFYGLQGKEILATSDGLYTNAVFGFINIMNKYLDEENPGYLCVAFDLKGPTFRHKEFDGYKANRKGMPQELAVQMPVIKEVLDAMNIKRLEYEGFEADDILGTVSLCAEKEGFEVVILTGDRDSLQLATDRTRIKLPVTKGWKTETEEYDYGKVIERYGVTPELFIDVKGLMGDTSDNIPGVPGIGEKTAVELVKNLGTIENIYENLDKVEKKSVKQKLEANKELAFLSKRLATIDRNAPERCGLDNLQSLQRKDVDREKLFALFKRLEFKSFIEKYNLKEEKAKSPVNLMSVETISDTGRLDMIKNQILSEKKCSIYYIIEKVDDFNSNLKGAGISWGKDKSVYLQITGEFTEDVFIDRFKEVFESDEVKKYGHDLKNLIVYLKNKGVSLNGLSFDTMIGAYILNPSRDTYTVTELAEDYMGSDVPSIEEMLGKGKKRLQINDLPLDELASVIGLYSELIFSLYELIHKKLDENDQLKLYYEIELPLVEVLANMEHLGIKVNIETLKSFSVEMEDRISQLIKDIYEFAGEEFNINSTKQLGVILFDRLKLPVIKKTKTGYSTDVEVLEQLEPMHEIVAKLLEYRHLVKLKSTYVEGLLKVMNPRTGRIHSSFNQTVTVTGRISSTEPNLQNIPVKLEMGRKIRKVFVPEDENYLLSDGDYSQIELRVLAHITGDENMIAAFISNEDIHTSTASKVFNVPKDQVTPFMRSSAKAVNFGIVYGIGDFSLSKDLGITRKEARKYIDEYLGEYLKVKQYMHDIVVQGKEMGFVSTIYNRRRYLPELKSSNFNIRSFGERIAMNTPIQGSAADIIKIAMVKVYKALKDRNLRSRLILQVHDELIIETHRDELNEVEELLKSCMETVATMLVPLIVEVRSGVSWYDVK